MTLTLGKKIGGGFSLIILLVLIMGLVAIRAMNAGVQVSRNIAEDRVPRMVLFSKLQNNLLLGAYHTRVYFETSDESSYATGMEYLGELKRNFSNLEALHQANPSAETQNFLHRFSKELVAYTDDISAGREYRININKTTSRLIEVGYTVLGKTEAFARAMSEVQCDFLDQGNTAAVVRYEQRHPRGHRQRGAPGAEGGGGPRRQSGADGGKAGEASDENSPRPGGQKAGSCRPRRRAGSGT